MKTDFSVGDRVYIDRQDEFLTELPPSLQVSDSLLLSRLDFLKVASLEDRQKSHSVRLIRSRSLPSFLAKVSPSVP